MTGLMVKIKSIWGLVLDFGLHSSAMQSRPLVFFAPLGRKYKGMEFEFLPLHTNLQTDQP